MNLTNEQILALCTDRREYFRGLEITDEISSIHSLVTEGYASADVAGDSHVEIHYNPDSRQIENYNCNCRFFAMRSGACRHIVALLKKFQAEDEAIINCEYTGNITQSVIKSLTKIKPYRGLNKVNILVTLYLTPERRVCQKYVDFRIGFDKLYIIKDIKQFIYVLNNGGSVRLGKAFTFDSSLHTLDAEYIKLFSFLSMIYDVKSPEGDNFGRRVVIDDSFFVQLLELLSGVSFSLMVDQLPIGNPLIKFETLPFELHANKNNDSYVLDFSEFDSITPLTVDFTAVYKNRSIYCLGSGQALILKTLYNAKLTSGQTSLVFADEDKTAFISDVLPKLRVAGKLKISKGIMDDCLFADLRVKVYLDGEGDGLKARVVFCYDDVEFNHFMGESPLSPEKVVIRDKKAENEFIIAADSYGFTAKNGMLFLNGDDRLYNFISKGIKKLSPNTDFYISDSVKRIRINHPSATTGTVSLSEGGLLEFSFDLGEKIPQSELSAILASVKEKKHYHRLKDGSFLELESGTLESLASLLDKLDLQPADIKKGKAILNKNRAVYAHSVIESLNINLKRSDEFSKFVSSLQQPVNAEYSLPQKMDGILREYQKEGFKWFKTLSQLGLGGILADEMGLGKTVQAIAFVMSEYEAVKLPTLIVCPTSLVFNWQYEIEKFAPNAKVSMASGQPFERIVALKNSSDCHFVITSYGNLRRDIAMYKDYSFAYCIVDEAQNIKNPNTINAKTVKVISAKGFFALTGTPLENNLTELWSIFDFIMPGYLHTRAKFKRLYELPIIKQNDTASLNELLKAVQPFILRRLKTNVLSELPEKIETEVLAELEDEQKSLYSAYASRAVQDIQSNVEQHGFGSSRIKILAVLTRLRQICCHPAMFIDDYKGESGKLELLMELIEDAMSSGRRLLIFSQFVSMLKIIEERLRRSHIKYFYIDGTIPGQERVQMCDAFNKGQRDVFLISLKAGGTGLNLTGADTVIHFDPWWNPAVENQATDRAHRIGQTKAVQVIKLIAKGTIEEKIYQIQRRKQAMIDSVIENKSTPIFNLTYDEIKGLFE